MPRKLVTKILHSMGALGALTCVLPSAMPRLTLASCLCATREKQIVSLGLRRKRRRHTGHGHPSPMPLEGLASQGNRPSRPDYMRSWCSDSGEASSAPEFPTGIPDYSSS